MDRPAGSARPYALKARQGWTFELGHGEVIAQPQLASSAPRAA